MSPKRGHSCPAPPCHQPPSPPFPHTQPDGPCILARTAQPPLFTGRKLRPKETTPKTRPAAPSAQHLCPVSVLSSGLHAPGQGTQMDSQEFEPWRPSHPAELKRTPAIKGQPLSEAQRGLLCPRSHSREEKDQEPNSRSPGSAQNSQHGDLGDLGSRSQHESFAL